MLNNYVFRNLSFFPKGETRSYQTYRSDYYNLKCELKTIKSLNGKINDIHNSQINIKTNLSINPLGLHFGISSKGLNKILGKPKYILKGSLDRNHQVLFYKLKSGGNGILVQMHLYQGKLVYVKAVFEYLKSTANTRLEVINTINTKYNINIGTDENIHTLVGDDIGNKMMIIDYGELGIHYFSGDSTVYSAMRNYCHRKQSLEFKHSTNYADIVLRFV